MPRWKNIFSRRTISGLLLILSFFLFGVQPDFKIPSALNFTGIAPAFANDESGEDSPNSGGEEIKPTIYTLRSILRMTPKQFRVLRKKLRFPSHYGILFVDGFSEYMSGRLFFSLAADTGFTKGLLREMRDAKSTKKRKEILAKHKKQLEKERVKLERELEKRKAKLSRLKREIDSDEEVEALERLLTKNGKKLDLIVEWSFNLPKGDKLSGNLQ